MELTRIASHCVWLGHARHRPRRDLGLFLLLRSAREHPRPARGRRRRAHASELRARRRAQRRSARRLLAKLDALIAKFPGRMRDLRGLLQANPIFQDRTIDVGNPHARRSDRVERDRSERCAAAASPTTCARRFRIADTRRTSSTFRRAPKATRTRASLCASTRWSSRCASSSRRASRLDAPGPVMIDDPKIAAPPKETIALSMEALIHHFKIVSEGFRVPPGDVYQSIEAPRGELGYYVVSNGENRPYRVRTRPPSMYNLQCIKGLAPGNLIADLVVMIGSLDPVFGEVDRYARAPRRATFRRCSNGCGRSVTRIIAQYEHKRSALLMLGAPLSSSTKATSAPMRVAACGTARPYAGRRRVDGLVLHAVLPPAGRQVHAASLPRALVRDQRRRRHHGVLSREARRRSPRNDRRRTVLVRRSRVSGGVRPRAVHAGEPGVRLRPHAGDDRRDARSRCAPARTTSKPLVQTDDARTHVGSPPRRASGTGRKSPGAIGVSNPNNAGGVGDRAA